MAIRSDASTRACAARTCCQASTTWMTHRSETPTSPPQQRRQLHHWRRCYWSTAIDRSSLPAVPRCNGFQYLRNQRGTHRLVRPRIGRYQAPKLTRDVTSSITPPSLVMLPPSKRPSTLRRPNWPKSITPRSSSPCAVHSGFGIVLASITFHHLDKRACTVRRRPRFHGDGEISGLVPLRCRPIGQRGHIAGPPSKQQSRSGKRAADRIFARVLGSVYGRVGAAA